MFLKFCQMCTRACFFPPYFSCPLLVSLFRIFAVFFYFLRYFTEMKPETVCARPQADFYGHLAIKSKKFPIVQQHRTKG